MPYQPFTGQSCTCRRGIERENCPQCEGTGKQIDFKKIREHGAARQPGWLAKDLGPATAGAIVRALDARRKVAGAFLVISLLLPLAAHAAEPCRVNVNSASPAQLALLISTGPALADKIEAARTAGPLDAAKLDAVSGIGTKWLEHNAPHVAYSGETTCKDKLKKPATTGETESDTVRREASGGGQ